MGKSDFLPSLRSKLHFREIASTEPNSISRSCTLPVTKDTQEIKPLQSFREHDVKSGFLPSLRSKLHFREIASTEPYTNKFKILPVTKYTQLTNTLKLRSREKDVRAWLEEITFDVRAGFPAEKCHINSTGFLIANRDDGALILTTFHGTKVNPWIWFRRSRTKEQFKTAYLVHAFECKDGSLVDLALYFTRIPLRGNQGARLAPPMLQAPLFFDEVSEPTIPGAQGLVVTRGSLAWSSKEKTRASAEAVHDWSALNLYAFCYHNNGHFVYLSEGRVRGPGTMKRNFTDYVPDLTGSQTDHRDSLGPVEAPVGSVTTNPPTLHVSFQVVKGYSGAAVVDQYRRLVGVVKAVRNDIQKWSMLVPVDVVATFLAHERCVDALVRPMPLFDGERVVFVGEPSKTDMSRRWGN